MLHRWSRRLLKSTIGIITLAILFISSLCLPILTQAQTPDQPTAQIRSAPPARSRQLEQSLQSWQQSLQRYQAAGDIVGQRWSLSGLGTTLLALERYQAAVETFEQLLSLSQDPSQSPTKARTLSNIGIAQKHLGQYRQALQAHKTAGKIFHRLVDRRSLGQVLLNLGNAYAALGDYEKAEIAYQQSLKIARQYQNRASETLLLSNLGGLYATLGENRKAITFLRNSLNLQQQSQIVAGQAGTLLNLGSVHHAQRQIPPAIDYYQQTLKLAQQTNDRQRQVDALSSLGLAYEDQKNYDQAINFHQQSVAIAQSLKSPERLAKALNNQGHTLYAAGQLKLAIASLNQAIQQLENLRPGLTDTYKVSLFDTQVYSYQLLQQILIADNQPEAALEASEQGRARAFAELLPSRTGQSTQTPINIQQIRQIAKTQNATIVEYGLVPDDEFSFLGKQRAKTERLLIWVVQPNGKITLRQVDTKTNRQTQGTLNQIVATARCLNPAPICPSVEEIANTRGIRISTVQPQSKPSTPIPENPAATSTNQTPDIKNALVYPGLPELHKLLIEPIADLLPNDPQAHVVIIPQESLFLIPFPALVNAQGEYLVQNHTLLSAPSIQVLGLTQRPTQAWTNPNELVVLGNPAPMPVNLDPLPAAGAEAIAVAQMLKTQPLLGKAATRQNLLGRVSQAKLIHLATHGLLEYGQTNSLDAPGAIALAQTQTEKDALLTATEIAQLKTQADLVVLSACDTGRGIITGDGVLGLSRSWIAAGASSIIVSLWAVNDQSTSYLMQEFYQALQIQPDRAIALRQAMLKTREKYPSPYDWSAFTLMGQAGG
ncbi:CHAT domain-containing protein [filamentous cyanobacterium LEGE 11480]|uniref:CHAT domain-containing protein n=1 Tax=Romeriopsis navalis LEGE 11480 TaxID=2777977 RepID=A0A928VNW6_9CYAN|nr:CHAT domain-containing protein [Romeriopsis navalis]MBE9032068.1 CHAT domain-containing protein [Romeriopsis navalis LEGE 11480]